MTNKFDFLSGRRKSQRTAEETEPPASRRGRPRGKRSNPDYEQITAYIRKETHRQIKLALLQEGEGKQFSEIVEEQLSKWLKSKS